MKHFLPRLTVLVGLLFTVLTYVSAHNYNAQGICTDADCTEPFEPAVQEDGWYLLRNAGNVEWFSALVNQGGNNIFLWGRLTCDSDFAGVTHTPIGVSEATKFNGRFDGQGHRALCAKHMAFRILRMNSSRNQRLWSDSSRRPKISPARTRWRM